MGVGIVVVPRSVRPWFDRSDSVPFINAQVLASNAVDAARRASHHPPPRLDRNLGTHRPTR
jgi:hypothetical protein